MDFISFAILSRLSLFLCPAVLAQIDLSVSMCRLTPNQSILRPRCALSLRRERLTAMVVSLVI